MPAKKNIKDKADKRRRARVRVGMDPQGKYIYKYASGRTQAELDAAKRDLVRRFTNRAVDADTINFGQYAVEWYELYKEGTVSVSSQTSYRTILNKHLLPVFGSRFMVSITSNDLQSFLNTFAGKSHSHIAKVRMTIKAIFKQAVAEGLLLRDPSLVLKLPVAKPKEERRALTAAEKAAVLSVCETDEHGLLLAVLYYLGLRRGEALGLMWQDVNFDDQTIRIQRDVDFHSSGEDTLGELKTRASNRIIPIPDPLMRMFKERRGIGLLFPAPTTGTPMPSKTFRRRWEALMGALVEANRELEKEKKPSKREMIEYKIVNKTGLDRKKYTVDQSVLTPHFFRHNYATMLHAAGVPVLQAQQWLGHTDLKVTLGVYSHLDKEVAAVNARALVAFFNE